MGGLLATRVWSAFPVSSRKDTCLPSCFLVLSSFSSQHLYILFLYNLLKIAELWFAPCEYSSLESGGVQLGFELTQFLRYTSYLIHPAFLS